MASWLKAAEDLFEVVDRRAKLVVNELADEQSDLQTPASNGQGSQAKKIKSRIKAQRRHSTDESLKINDTPRKQTSTQASQVDVTSSKDRAALAVEKETIPTGNTQKNSEQQSNNERDASSIPSTEPAKDETKHDADEVEVPATVTDTDTAISTSNGELLNKNYSDVHVEHPPSPLPPKEKEIVNEDHSDDAGQITKSADADILLKIDNETQVIDPPVSSESPLKNADVLDETPANKKDEQELKADDPPAIVQDQLDESQGLLKTAIYTGQSKEARLARVCAGLSSRLQEYKSENAQLEELLVAERELSRSYEARIKQLQQELSVSKSEVMKVESNLAEALAAKNSEIENLVNSIDKLKKQAALSEGNLASLQMNMESIMRNRELTETRMMQSLREELASAERRAEEEHAAHNATKMAAMKREVELEHRAVEASTALARIQRIVDERTAKAGDLEQKVAMLEVECATLHQELQDMESRVKRGQKKSPEEANQLIQAWQEEVERACQGKRDAESKLSSLEAEVQKMRVEMAAMKRDAEHYSREEHMELEKRYRELTDLLYYKQTQLETMASEKAAAEFQLEKEAKRLQEAQVEAERSRVSRRSWSSWEEDSEMKSLEPLPLHHRHMAVASIQLQKAAKLLDSGAVRATRFLWRYPIARIILLFYLVFHREKNDDISSKNELSLKDRQNVDDLHGDIGVKGLDEISPEVQQYILHLQSRLSSFEKELCEVKRKRSALQMQQFVGEEKNDLLDYLRSLQPEKVAELSEPTCPDLKETIHSVVHGLLATLSPKMHSKAPQLENTSTEMVNIESEDCAELVENTSLHFQPQISLTRDYLARLLFWCMLLGHYLGGLEYRMKLTELLSLTSDAENDVHGEQVA